MLKWRNWMFKNDGRNYQVAKKIVSLLVTFIGMTLVSVRMIGG